jgi:hypothetical protein
MGILLIIDGTVIRLTVERLLGGAEAIPSMPYHHPQPQQDGFAMLRAHAGEHLDNLTAETTHSATGQSPDSNYRRQRQTPHDTRNHHRRTSAHRSWQSPETVET